jgi:hypothetical protein
MDKICTFIFLGHATNFLNFCCLDGDVAVVAVAAVAVAIAAHLDFQDAFLNLEVQFFLPALEHVQLFPSQPLASF